MSTSDPIAPERLEALLRGEAGSDGRERRMGALLDELVVGEIAPPAELRERVRALTATAVVAAPASRRLGRLRSSRPRLRLAPALGLAAVAAVIAGALAVQTRTSSPVAAPHLRAGQELEAVRDSTAKAVASPYHLATSGTGALAPPPARSTAPLPDGQRAQDYSASLRLAVGTVAELSRSTQTVLDTVRSLAGAVETVDYGTPSTGSGSALIALRVPVARAQEALARFSALGTITAQQVQIRDLQSGLDQESNRARRCVTASRCSRHGCSRRRSRQRIGRHSRDASRTPRRRSQACSAVFTRRSSGPHSRASRSSSTPATAPRFRLRRIPEPSRARRTTPSGSSRCSGAARSSRPSWAARSC